MRPNRIRFAQLALSASTIAIDGKTESTVVVTLTYSDYQVDWPSISRLIDSFRSIDCVGLAPDRSARTDRGSDTASDRTCRSSFRHPLRFDSSTKDAGLSGQVRDL